MAKRREIGITKEIEGKVAGRRKGQTKKGMAKGKTGNLDGLNATVCNALGILALNIGVRPSDMEV
jgi:hypothetical protein